MRHEPGGKGLKAIILGLCVLTPLLFGVARILAALTYTGLTVRAVNETVTTADIADWISYDALTARKWHRGESSRFLQYPRLAESYLMYNSLRNQISFTADSLSASQGSGLPTILTFNQKSGEPVILGYLTYRNAIVHGVPGNVRDFAIEQDMLLIQKMCRVAEPSAEINDTYLEGFEEGVPFWRDILQTQPKHAMPLWQSEAETGRPGGAYDYSSSSSSSTSGSSSAGGGSLEVLAKMGL